MWSLLEKVHCGLDRGEDTGALTHHRIASSWGQDATLSYPLSISHWVWFPPTNFLGEGTLHLALGNFPSSGGIYEPSAANTQSSWGSFTSPANGWGWGVAGTTGASSKVQNTESHREMPLVALPTQAAHSHTDTHRTQRVSGGGDFKKHTSAFQNQNVISLHSEKLRGNGSTFIK